MGAMIKIIAKDSEFGEEDNIIGNLTYKVELTDNATGIDVIKSTLRMMDIVGYHPHTIIKALQEVLEERKVAENDEPSNANR